MVSRNTAFDLLCSVPTISASRGDRRLINATLRINLADAESQLGVTNTQLSVARRDLEAPKILLSEAQQALLEIEDRFAIDNQEHLVTKRHLLIAQQTLSDLQDTASAAQQLSFEVEHLRRDRDRALNALNFARDSLDPSFPAFDRQQVDRILRRLVHPVWETARLEGNRPKVLQVLSRVEIGHRDYMGKQIVYCNPLHKPDSEKQDATTGRMDCVFFIPPPPFYDGRRRDFDLSLENAWYGRVSLLFSMKFRTDSGEVRDVDCAMIDVFFNYAEGRCFVCTLVHSHVQNSQRYTD